MIIPKHLTYMPDMRLTDDGIKLVGIDGEGDVYITAYNALRLRRWLLDKEGVLLEAHQRTTKHIEDELIEQEEKEQERATHANTEETPPDIP